MSVKTNNSFCAFSALQALIVTVAICWTNSVIASSDDDAALIKASQAGDIKAVQALIDKGANINAKRADGASALIQASMEDHLDVVQTLLAKGADINAKNRSGESALKVASMLGYSDVVQLLIAKGADVNAKDNDGLSAIMSAAKEGNLDVVEILERAGAKDATVAKQKVQVQSKATIEADEALNNAITTGDINAVKALLTKGYDLNHSYGNQYLPLYWAAMKGHLDIVKLLLANGADVNAVQGEELEAGEGNRAWFGAAASI
jgi:ankyrin repeat protein